MSVIRVGLVGLSASAKVTWASDAHLPYLFSSYGRKHYKLVALLNSSVAAAESAKKTFDLPQDVKAYGDPESFAADPDIDLVVVNTRVDVHFPVAQPSIKAGKRVYIEWPLTESLERGLELTKDYANYEESIVGLQGRVAPITIRIKEILASGLLGKVLSSEIRAYGNLMARDSLPESLTYFADRKVGGHPINIHYGHMIDYVHEVLGDWETSHSTMQIQRPQLKVTGRDGEVVGSIQSDVPDFLSVHGTLKQNKGVTVPGASLTATFRLGPPFKNEHGLRWTIAGEKGELRILAPGPYLMSGDSFNGPITIDFYDHATDEIEQLKWDWPEWQKQLPLRARSVGEVYERYAEWFNGGKGKSKAGREWPSLADGVRLLKEFDGLYKSNDRTW